MAEIHSLEKERDRRMIEQMLKDVESWGGFKIDLDITNVPVQFIGSGSGKKGKPGQSRLCIIAYDTSGPTVQVFGAVQMTGAQWEEFKKIGDGLLQAIERVSE